jgi:hypothetical protein
MTLYDESFDLPMAFGPVHLENILGEVLSRRRGSASCALPKPRNTPMSPIFSTVGKRHRLKMKTAV